MEKRKQLTLKQKRALLGGAAALAAFGAGAAATNANAHADNTQQPQGTVRTGSPAIQTVQEKQGNNQPQGPVANPAQGGQKAAPQANTNTQNAGAPKGTQAPANNRQSVHTNNGVQNPGHVQVPSRAQVPNNNSTRNANTGVQSPRTNNALKPDAPEVPHVPSQPAQAPSQPANPKAGRGATGNPQANQPRPANGTANGNQNSLPKVNNKGVKAGNQSNPLNGLNKDGKNGAGNNVQNPVLPSRKQNKNDGAANGSRSLSKDQVNGAKGNGPANDQFHPTFIIGPSKQQLADHSADLRESRADGISNVFNEYENAVGNVNRRDLEPIMTHSINAIEQASGQQDIAKIAQDAVDSLDTLERGQDINNVLSGKNNTLEDPTPADPIVPSQLDTTGAPANNSGDAQFDLSSDGKTLTINGNVIPNDNITNGVTQGINAHHNYDSVTTLNLNNSKIVGDGQNLFAGMPNLQTVTGSVDASQADDLEGTFADDPQLTDIGGLQNWKLPSTDLDLYGMFEYDTKLSNIQPLAHWNAANVDSVGKMFADDPQLSDWTPIENNWKFNSEPEVNGMFANDPANKGLDPSYQKSNNQTMLGAGDPNDADNYIVNGPASNHPNSSSADNMNNGKSDTGLVTFANPTSGSSSNGSNASVNNGSASSKLDPNNPASKDTVQTDVIYHDPSGKVIGVKQIAEPAGSILDVAPGSEFEKHNMPNGYKYDTNSSDPTQYLMEKGMQPIEVSVVPTDNANDQNSDSNDNNASQPASGASWQRGAVSPQQLTHPVDIEPAGGFGNAATGSTSETTPSATNAMGNAGNNQSVAGGSTEPTTDNTGSTVTEGNDAGTEAVPAGVESAPEADNSASGNDESAGNGNSSLPQTHEDNGAAALAMGLGAILSGLGLATDRRKHLALRQKMM